MAGALRAACFGCLNSQEKLKRLCHVCSAQNTDREGRVRARLLCRLWTSWGLLGDAVN